MFDPNCHKMTNQSTPGSPTFNDCVKCLLGCVAWGKEPYPLLRLDTDEHNDIKRAIKLVFPWLSQLSDTKRQQMHQEYEKLYDVRGLIINIEDFTELCPSLIGCMWLQELKITRHIGNSLTDSSDNQQSVQSPLNDIGHLTWLKKLDVEDTNLTHLPQSLYHCKQLETLLVLHNKLNSLHEDIGCFSFLKHLDIDSANLTDLPRSLYQCKTLEKLSISDNQLNYLHEDIGCLSCLKVIYLNSNNLSDLPQSLYQCKQLEKLCVPANQLHSLHEDIGCLRCLKYLSVSSNSLTELPKSLCQCKQLEVLHVSDNQLHFLPEDIGYLKRLKYLEAASNNLTDLPQSLCQCKQLERLSVHFNSLQSLPEEIGQLSSLKHLHVFLNKLTDLPVSLYQCNQMQQIDVSDNQLKYIHEEIGELACLKTLNIYHNNIKSLPLEILRCTELKQLKAGNNNLNIPNAVLDSGVNTIFSYLQEIRRKGSIQNNNRNIMLLGNTLAGKTSLLKSLLSGMPYLTNVEDRTHGMEKHKWMKKTPNKPYPYMNIRICDFGGHACYNITTVFFWNESSLFLVVFDLKTYDPHKYRLMVGQWIEMISEAIPKAVILIVGTHKDQCPDSQARQILKEVTDRCDEEERIKQEQIKHNICDMRSHKQNVEKLQEMLKQRPFIIQETFAVSCKTFEGIEIAGDTIVSILENETQFLTKVIPLTWHHLRDLLSAQTGQQQSTPWLSWDTVRQLCSKAELKTDNESIREALRYLKLSSDILWYEDNDILRNIVFNQPNELIDIFKALISHDLNQQLSNIDPRFSKFTNAELSRVKVDLVRQAKLTKDLLQCIWQDYISDEASFELLVMLMIKFDFGYILPRQGNCLDVSKFEEIRIPWFLKDDEPALVVRQWPVDLPAEQQQIAIKVEFHRWAPPSLLPSLCVRVHIYVSQTIEWKNGLLATTAHGNRLLLKLVTENENEAVLLYMRGKDLHKMWQVLLPIQREMDALLDMWPGVIFSRVVSCPGCARKSLPDPTLHSDRWLYEVCPHTEIHCDTCVDTEPLKAEMVYPPLEVLQTLDAQYQREDSNFLRYQKLVFEYGSKMPQKILENCLSPKTLQEWLQENKDVFCKRLRREDKWIHKLLYPQSGSVKVADLDITTLNTIVKFLDNFPPPSNGWTQEPALSDLSQAADLLRLAKFRNNLAHFRKCQLTDAEFEKRWAQAEAVIKRLGGDEKIIRRLKFAQLHKCN